MSYASLEDYVTDVIYGFLKLIRCWRVHQDRKFSFVPVHKRILNVLLCDIRPKKQDPFMLA